MKDFHDEIACYTQVDVVIEILDNINLSNSPGDNLLNIYGALSDAGVVKRTELDGVKAWLEDLSRLIEF